jgi:hypothetical protein
VQFFANNDLEYLSKGCKDDECAANQHDHGEVLHYLQLESLVLDGQVGK